MNHQFVGTVILALITGPGGWGLLQLWLSHKQKQRDVEKDRQDQDAKAKRDKQIEDSQTWYRESKYNYKVAKDEATAAKKECAVCMKELQVTRQVIYRMLEDLEDQIIPMLMLPDTSPAEIRVAMRATIKTARDGL
jgi:hypothetical protein